MAWQWYPSRPTVGQQRAQAEKRLAKLRRQNPDLRPVVVEGTKLAKTWWGLAWNRNLERYADYANRIGRGRSYVKNGLVLDLRIAEGIVTGIVSGSSLYDVRVTIEPLPEPTWRGILKQAARQIESVGALAEGRFPEEMGDIFFAQGTGLFPAPREIRLGCSCPDYATMCKHVAAVLYGVGARLDEEPLLFFTLRGIDATELVQRSVEEKMASLLQNAAKRSQRAIDEADVARLFGV
jgi:uncharacterized Zn finger protein